MQKVTTALVEEYSSDDLDGGSDVEVTSDHEVCQLSKELEKANLTAQGSSIPNNMEVEDIDFEVIEDQDERRWRLSGKSLKFLNEWKQVSKYGKLVEGTNILPMKTPMMKKKWLEHTQMEERFDLVELIQELKRQNKKVGAVVDISTSDRGYYNWQSLYDKNPELLKNIDYRKIKFGSEDVASRANLNKVYDVLNKNLFKDNIVLIHCTRGINKTGHAISYFLCKKLELSPSEAIKRFEEARGYHIQKRNIVEDLQDRFGCPIG